MFSFLKNTLIALALVGASTPLLFAADAVRFEITLSQDPVLDTATDITVTAVDTNGKTDTDYSGNIFFLTDNGNDTVPSPGSEIEFSSKKEGVYTFSDGITFHGKTGTREISVYDIKEGIKGQTTIVVIEKAKSTPTNNKTSQTKTTSPSLPITDQSNNPWYIFHAAIANQGYTWTGTTAEYLAGFEQHSAAPLTEKGLSNIQKNTYISQNMNYEICVQENLSQKEIVLLSDMSLVQSTAKKCAQEAYGSYFSGKSYTTREEVLMLAHLYFDTGNTLTGIFENGKFVSLSSSQEAWYLPFVQDIADINTTWEVAKEISDTETWGYFNALATKYTTNNVLTKNTKTKSQIQEKWTTLVNTLEISNSLLAAVTEEVPENSADTTSSAASQDEDSLDTLLASLLGEVSLETDTTDTTESTSSTSDQKSLIETLLGQYFQIHDTYPEALSDLENMPYFDTESGEYTLVTAAQVTAFEKNFTYYKLLNIYTLTQK